jgi:predicted lipid-binding transport protein (Tim44 family)
MPATIVSLFLAAAGGGSSGFGGGGGGGGFSGGGGGSSFGGGGGYYGGSGHVSGGFVLGIFGLILVFVLFLAISAGLATMRYRRKRRDRVKQVQMASYEAAEDDAWFAHEAVVSEATALFNEVQAAWDADDRDRLSTLVGRDLMIEWERRLKDFSSRGWHNRVEVLDGPHIEYVGLVNRDDDRDDRVVVRIEATLRDYVQTRQGRRLNHNGSDTDRTTLCEYWTLARAGDQWMCVSIEQRAEGDHHLDGEIVASPWSDTQALRDEALVEGAVAAKVPEGFSTADIATVDFDGDARQEALDLSLADGRFAPDVLEAAVRRAVKGWVEAIDGEDAPLLEVATPDAVHALLHGGDASERTRVVVRGPVVERVAIAGVDAKAEPAQMTVALTVRGRRYVEDRDTAAVVSGDKEREGRFTERWVLTLDGSDAAPWRIVSTSGAVLA